MSFARSKPTAWSENVQPNYVHTTQEQQSQEQPRASGEPSPSEQAVPEGPRQYALDKLRLPQAHALAKGDKVLIAVIDSVIDTAHPELAGMVVTSYDALGTPRSRMPTAPRSRAPSSPMPS